MIDLTTRTAPDSPRHLKIVGIGGAGSHILDRMALDGVNPAHLLALHTDAQLLRASVAGGKIQLGANLTRGLGTGGDPETGAAATAEAEAAVRNAFEGLDAVFLVGGLGGGTGSGAAPALARLAREAGALVIALVTLPFTFEGRRRGAQAHSALAALRCEADVVVCYENDRMADGVAPGAGVAQAFGVADQLLSQSVQAINALFLRKGLIHIGLDEFRLAMGGHRCSFGFGAGEGNNRAFDALARAVRTPLMDKGRSLRDSDRVLVALAGGEDFSLNEMELLMEEFQRQIGTRPRVFFTVAVDPQLAGVVTVTLFSSQATESQSIEAPVAPAAVAPAPTLTVVEREEAPSSPSPTPAPSSAPPELSIFRTEEPAPPQAAPAETTPEVENHLPQEPIVEPETASPAREVVRPIARPQPGRSLRRSTSSFLNPRPGNPPASEPQPAPEPVLEAAQEAAPPEPAPQYEAEPVAESLETETPAPLQESLAPVPAAPEPEPSPAPSQPSEPVAPVPPPSGPKRTPTQETMKFEPVTRGRFEKSEPTIIDGQDLDIPTFLRRNLRIRSR